MSEVALRPKIESLERELLGMPQADILTNHVLSGGMYARTIIIPAGVALTGAVHKHDHLNIVQGDITVMTDEGMKRLTGQHVLATKAGMKRAGFTHSETIWTTICRTDETDLASIENDAVESPETLQTRKLIGDETCHSG